VGGGGGALAACFLPYLPDDDPERLVRALAVFERLKWYTCPRGTWAL
jgi:hypothetical protein